VSKLSAYVFFFFKVNYSFKYIFSDGSFLLFNF